MSNVKIVKDNSKKVLDNVSGNMLAKAVRAGALFLETKIKVSMATGSHTGKTYFRGKNKHQASAPGQTPAVDTSILIHSISTWAISQTDKTAWAGTGTGIEYAEWLEFGTSKMQPRPFMRPAFDNNKQAVEDLIRKQIKRLIEEAIT